MRSGARGGARGWERGGSDRGSGGYSPMFGEESFGDDDLANSKVRLLDTLYATTFGALSENGDYHTHRLLPQMLSAMT